MNKNMGMMERNIRATGGILFLLAGIWAFSSQSTVIALILIACGVSLLLEAAYRWCPLKAMLGLGKEHHNS